MKKLAVFVIAICAVNLAFATEGNPNEPKPIVSNYMDVMQEIVYPEVCRDKGIEGVVMLKVLVDRNGQVKKYKVVDAPCSDLKKAVLDVAPLLQFEAAQVDGKSVSSKITIPVNFKLTL